MSDERLLRAFLELVRIDSPSYSEARIAEHLATALSAAGCSVRFDETAGITGSDSGNLIAEMPGTAPGVLILSAHMDTVEPGRGVEPVIRDGVVFAAGETVLGADDKAGLAAIIEALLRLREGDDPYPTIRCVFTVAEEWGLVGAKALDPAEVVGDLCLVLDADGLPGAVVTAAPTQYTFTAGFHGKAAHAGVQPERGVSAIEMASAAICRMRLGRVDEETTSNVGTIEGGAATNIVTSLVTATGECRSLDREVIEALRAEMQQAMEDAAREAGGRVDVEWRLGFEGFRHDSGDPMLELLAAAMNEAGLTLSTYATGGGSDANIIAATGTPTFALACGMQDVHGTEESIAVTDLEALTRIVVAVARRMAEAALRS